MQGLDHRGAGLPAGPVGGGGDKGKRVVKVRDVGASLTDEVEHPQSCAGRPDGPHRGGRPPDFLDASIVHDILRHVVTMTSQEGALLEECGVLAAALQIPVVDEKDPQFRSPARAWWYESIMTCASGTA